MFGYVKSAIMEILSFSLTTDCMKSATRTRWIAAGVLMGVLFFILRPFLYRMCCAVGMKVDQVFVEGRLRTPKGDLLKVLGLQGGECIFALCLPELKQLLTTCPWVRSAIVERRLPSTLYIRLCEREPAAIWHHKGQRHLVDQEGGVIWGIDPPFPPQLLLIIGQHAPQNFHALKKALEPFQPILPPIKAAVFLRSHRWNLYLANGSLVKLPEENLKAALEKLVRLVASPSPLPPAIDLRFSDAIILDPQPLRP